MIDYLIILKRMVEEAERTVKAAQAKAFLATNTANMEYDKLRALEIVYNKARIEAEE